MVFSTAEKLLPADGDTAGTDLYDRRADDSLHLVSGGTTDALAAGFMGENADGSVVFQTSDALVAADTDISSDVYLRQRAGALVLLTPDTAGSLGRAVPRRLDSEHPAPHRVLGDRRPPGTGDVNGLTDAYEATGDGAHLLASGAQAAPTGPAARRPTARASRS